MAITYTIPRFRLLNQLNEQSNPRDDCVFTSSAMIVNALIPGANYTGTQIKAMDNNYGPKYVGFASEANLVDTMDKLGVSMSRQGNSTQAGLIALLHSHLAAGRPCIVTMPSQWNSAVTVKGYNPRTYTGYSHVGVACGYGPGMIRVANPWGGFFQDGTDAYWALRLLTGDVWVAAKKPVVVVAPAPAPKPVAPAPVVAATGAMTDAEKLAAIAKVLAS